MAYQNYDNTFDDSKLAWDLRQFYAKYSALYMVDYKKAEDANDYPAMLKVLDKWHSTVAHEWIQDKKDEDFEKFRANVVKLSNDHNLIWFGRKKDNAKAVYEIEMALMEMKKYLMRNMKEAGMFGTIWNDDGL